MFYSPIGGAVIRVHRYKPSLGRRFYRPKQAACVRDLIAAGFSNWEFCLCDENDNNRFWLFFHFFKSSISLSQLLTYTMVIWNIRSSMIGIDPHNKGEKKPWQARWTKDIRKSVDRGARRLAQNKIRFSWIFQDLETASADLDIYQVYTWHIYRYILYIGVCYRRLSQIPLFLGCTFLLGGNYVSHEQNKRFSVSSEKQLYTTDLRHESVLSSGNTVNGQHGKVDSTVNGWKWGLCFDPHYMTGQERKNGQQNMLLDYPKQGRRRGPRVGQPLVLLKEALSFSLTAGKSAVVWAVHLRQWKSVRQQEHQHVCERVV